MDTERRRPHGLLRRSLREPSLLIGAAVMLVIVIMALAAPLLAPHDPNDVAPSEKFHEPAFVPGGSSENLLGTDYLGRDILSRLIYGARVSVLIGVSSVIGAGAIGVIVGSLAGFYGKWVDEVLMRLVDMGLAIPFLLLALTIILLLGPGLTNIILILSVTGWLSFARITRGVTLSVRERDYITAVRSYGASDARIIVRHIIPNLMAPILVLASQQLGAFIYAESSLSFLGLGVPLSTPTWGTDIALGRNYLATSWWVSTLPGIFLTITVLGAFFLGDGLRDTLDPRLRK